MTINNTNLEDLLDEYEVGELDTVEESDLLVLREEEKLARDVYKVLYDEFNQNIFNNIASSEQTHTDAVLTLIDRYDLTDPVGTNDIGVFEDDVLQSLYDDLVSAGENSLLDALVVGATIEDLDIKDIEEMIDRTDNEDLILVYELLQKGSRNHLRSFISQIEDVDSSYVYVPQYITQDEFDDIINSPMEIK